MSDDTYVHEPGTVEGSDGDTTEEEDDPADAYPRNTVGDVDEEFDWRGWLLVAAIVVAFLIVPGALYLLPAARGSVAALGWGWRNTYLALPLIPALVLAAIAVWSAVRSRTD
ncbi:hypothetical protein [Halorientalis pallida]|uniref:Uncharacterized protein n=1 Tax=Halorientalis pallida TaxID=2479928 RepID=A0A498L597_9EURY|nr:hypothetical protein [Halorientalis pallida]RXK51844.1 hypothetical protein EAF64_04205 [Halorientalis pallida]